MAVQLVRLPTLEAPGPLDFKPISNALDDFRKNREAADRQAEADRNYALNERRVGLAESQAQRGNQQSDEEKQKAAIGGVVQSIDNIPVDDPRRQQAWSKFVASQPHYGQTLTSYGQDPNDHINGPKFVLGQLQGPTSPDQQANIDYKRALTAQANAQSGATTSNANARSMEVYGKLLSKMGEKPDEATWNRESQPGGLVNAAFAGRMIPYSDSATIMAQVKRRATTPPEDHDLIDLGFTDDEIKEMRRQRAISEATGNKPSSGYTWTPDLRQQDAREAGVNKKVNPQSVQFFLNDLQMAKQDLAGENKEDGSLKGNGAYGVAKGMARATGGILLPAHEQAFTSVEHAVSNLTAMVEGQRHANAMDQRFLQYFVPKWWESDKMTAFKISQAHRFFSSMIAAKGTTPDADYGSLLQSELRKSAKEIIDKQNAEAKAKAKTKTKSGAGGQPAGGGWGIEKLPDEPQ